MFRVLSNYSKYNTEIGYVQGMTFIVAAFLTYMNEESAFFMFDSLVKNYGMKDLFSPGFPKLNSKMYIYLNLLKKYIPNIYKRFKILGIKPSMYANKWFLCLFSTHLRFNSLVRVFDAFFLEGYKIIYRIALAVVKINEKKILELESDLVVIMEYSKTMCEGINPDSLLKTAFGFSLSNKDIIKLENEYENVKDNDDNEFIQQL